MISISTIWNKIKEGFKKMFSTKTIENVLHVTPAISNDMVNAIQLWTDMYEGKAPWLKTATDDDPAEIKSLGLPQIIASEKARTALLEFKSEITGDSERAIFLEEKYKDVKKQLRTQIEYGVAKGGLVIKPYISNGSISFDYVQADDFYPLSFDSTGRVTEAAFVQRKVDKAVTYTRIEHHKIVDNTITVLNMAFKTTTDKQTMLSTNSIGQRISLSEVPEWADLTPEITIAGVDRLLFAYFKMPEANNLDTRSPLGVSGYSKAVDLIAEADKQFSRILWEYEGSELAIDVDRNALRPTPTYDDNGNLTTKSELGKLQQRLYRQLDLGNDETYKVFSPAIRDDSLINGLNVILMRIEDACALSRGTLSDINAIEKTATELKIMKQRSYQANASIQTAIQDALEDVIYVMNVYCDLYGLVPFGEYDISFEWDDSIIVDLESELGTRLTLLDKGILSKIELRMWYFGETEEQAREALAKVSEEKTEAIQASQEAFSSGQPKEDGEAEEEGAEADKESDTADKEDKEA